MFISHFQWAAVKYTICTKSIDTFIWITLWNTYQTFYMNGVYELMPYIKSLRDWTNYFGHLVGSPSNHIKSIGDWLLGSNFHFNIAAGMVLLPSSKFVCWASMNWSIKLSIPLVSFLDDRTLYLVLLSVLNSVWAFINLWWCVLVNNGGRVSCFLDISVCALGLE